MLSRSVLSDSRRPHRPEPARLPGPRDFPGKNTGAGCHFLLQGSFPTQGQNLCLLPPALAGGFFTTEPPGTPFTLIHHRPKNRPCRISPPPSYGLLSTSQPANTSGDPPHKPERWASSPPGRRGEPRRPAPGAHSREWKRRLGCVPAPAECSPLCWTTPAARTDASGGSRPRISPSNPRCHVRSSRGRWPGIWKY